MSEEWRIRAGTLFRQCRESIITVDDKALDRSILAREAKVSEKTVQRVENGEAIGAESLVLLLRALKQKGLGASRIEMLENAFNPVRIDRFPLLDDKERPKIREELRSHMRDILPPLPAYVMDEYWFVRSINVYMLALHWIEPKMLYWPEMWHVVACKFKPELRFRQRRGPWWKSYYLATTKGFHRRTTDLKDSKRYEKLIQWMKGLDDFAVFWNKAVREPELDYATRARTTRTIPVDLRDVGLGTQSWQELGKAVVVSPSLPEFWLSVWLPQVGSRKIQFPEALEPTGLRESAKKLGYNLDAERFLYIEDYIPKEKLINIGGYI